MNEPWKKRKPRRRLNSNKQDLTMDDDNDKFKTTEVLGTPPGMTETPPVVITETVKDEPKHVTPTLCSTEEAFSIRQEFEKAGLFEPQTKDFYTFTKDEINCLLKATDDVIERAISIMYRVMLVEEKDKNMDKSS